MDERPLGVHQIKLGVQTGPRLGDGRRVGQHADGPLHVCQIVIRHDGGRLIVDGHFESGRTPDDKVYRPFRLDERIGHVHVLRRHVTPVQPPRTTNRTWSSGWRAQNTRSWCRPRRTVRDEPSRRVRHHREVYPRVRHQVGLKLGQVHVQRPVKPQRSGDGRHDLSNQTVQVWVRRTADVQVPVTYVVYRFVVHHERAIRMRPMSGKHRIVRLYHCCKHLKMRINCPYLYKLNRVLLKIIIMAFWRNLCNDRAMW